jgi:hypothetical protein
MDISILFLRDDIRRGAWVFLVGAGHRERSIKFQERSIYLNDIFF